MPDVLVLGADGFIGSHLCDSLVARGLSVRAFDRFPGGVVHNLVEQDGVERRQGDFLNRHDVEHAIEGCRFVVHLVSTTTPATSASDPAFDVETNVRGSVELFSLCAAANVERVIFASTGGAIYGRDVNHPLREDELARPISPYAIGKLAIEGYLRFYRESHGLDSRVFRISNPYGERQALVGAQGAVPIFLKRMFDGDPITVFGDGSMVRDYIYVRDMTDMIATTLDRTAQHHVYNLASGSALSVLELLDALAKASGATPIIEHAPDRTTDVHRVVLDTTRFVTDFGLSADTPMSVGLANTVRYVRDQLELTGP